MIPQCDFQSKITRVERRYPQCSHVKYHLCYFSHTRVISDIPQFKNYTHVNEHIPQCEFLYYEFENHTGEKVFYAVLLL